jgi:peptidoglycan/xylan/chitin deacetylase (PgdA/CDA1 family)
MSFDDGPDPTWTHGLLDVLDEQDAAATFFWLGDRLADSPDVVARVASSRHQIGMHGETHRAFFGRPAHGIKEELDRLRHRLADLTGREPGELAFARPPFGLIGRRQAAFLQDAGYRVVICDVLPGDWAAPCDVVVSRVLSRARGGSIVVLHDSGPAGSGVAATVSRLIPSLRERGLRLVTVSELDRLGPATSRPC